MARLSFKELACFLGVSELEARSLVSQGLKLTPEAIDGYWHMQDIGERTQVRIRSYVKRLVDELMNDPEERETLEKAIENLFGVPFWIFGEDAARLELFKAIGRGMVKQEIKEGKLIGIDRQRDSLRHGVGPGKGGSVGLSRSADNEGALDSGPAHMD